MTKALLKPLGVAMRAEGFRGSGQNYRSHHEKLHAAVSIQGARSGMWFYVNLGIQPSFLYTRRDRPFDPNRLSANECVFVTRVGNDDWSWERSPEDIQRLVSAIVRARREKLERLADFERAVREDAPERLLQIVSCWRPGIAILHLARAALTLNVPAQTQRFAEYGLELNPEGSLLRPELLRMLSNATAAV